MLGQHLLNLGFGNALNLAKQFMGYLPYLTTTQGFPLNA